MILIVKCGRPKINQIDMRTQQHPSELRTPRIQSTTARDIPIIRKSLIVVVEKQDVLRFEVGMDEIEVVKEGNRT